MISDWRITHRGEKYIERDYLDTSQQVETRLESLRRKGHRIIKVEHRIGNVWSDEYLLPETTRIGVKKINGKIFDLYRDGENIYYIKDNNRIYIDVNKIKDWFESTIKT